MCTVKQWSYLHEKVRAHIQEDKVKNRLENNAQCSEAGRRDIIIAICNALLARVRGRGSLGKSSIFLRILKELFGPYCRLITNVTTAAGKSEFSHEELNHGEAVRCGIVRYRQLKSKWRRSRKEEVRKSRLREEPLTRENKKTDSLNNFKHNVRSRIYKGFARANEKKARYV